MGLYCSLADDRLLATVKYNCRAGEVQKLTDKKQVGVTSVSVEQEQIFAELICRDIDVRSFTGKKIISFTY